MPAMRFLACLSQFEGNNNREVYNAGAAISSIVVLGLSQLFPVVRGSQAQSLRRHLQYCCIKVGLLNSFKIDHRQITDIYKHHKIYSFPSVNNINAPERVKKATKKQP